MKPIISCPPLPLRVAAAASVAAAMTIPTLTAYAGSAPASGPNPGVQGWLADPLPQSLAATAAPPWAQELAKTSVTTNPSDPHFTQDVADTAVRLYQHCLNLASRCHAPALADVQGLVGSVARPTARVTCCGPRSGRPAGLSTPSPYRRRGQRRAREQPIRLLRVLHTTVRRAPRPTSWAIKLRPVQTTIRPR